LADLYQAAYPEDKKMRAAVNVGQIARFLSELKVGDYVITPYTSDDPRLLIGKVTSDVYREVDASCPFPHRRKVEWQEQELNRKSFSIPLQSTLKSSQTCFLVKWESEVLEAIGKPAKHASTIKSTPQLSLHENIRRKFLALEATEFELLVSYVLQTLGFEASQRTGHVGDGNVDYTGVLDVMGVASVKLQVQVKRYENTTISESEIRNFRGALKNEHQGCYVSLSKFSKNAYINAADPQRIPINIIDGEKFVDIFIEQYDKIIEAIRTDDNDELADKLRFKKTLLPL
jgi:restriction system protein